jgi:metal-responsive CopG/Arc/MetJ family transcriptional regulator
MATTRTHVVLPTELVEEIDRIAGKRKRSEFIEETLRERLIRERQREAFRQCAGILKDAAIPEWETPEKTYEWVRRGRELDMQRLEELLKQWDE